MSKLSHCVFIQRYSLSLCIHLIKHKDIFGFSVIFRHPFILHGHKPWLLKTLRRKQAGHQLPMLLAWGYSGFSIRNFNNGLVAEFCFALYKVPYREVLVVVAMVRVPFKWNHSNVVDGWLHVLLCMWTMNQLLMVDNAPHEVALGYEIWLFVISKDVSNVISNYGLGKLLGEFCETGQQPILSSLSHHWCAAKVHIIASYITEERTHCYRYRRANGHV